MMKIMMKISQIFYQINNIVYNNYYIDCLNEFT